MNLPIVALKLPSEKKNGFYEVYNSISKRDITIKLAWLHSPGVGVIYMWQSPLVEFSHLLKFTGKKFNTNENFVTEWCIIVFSLRIYKNFSNPRFEDKGTVRNGFFDKKFIWAPFYYLQIACNWLVQEKWCLDKKRSFTFLIQKWKS